jgi:ATP-dependent Clp protease ATP-binding subunit ClpA
LEKHNINLTLTEEAIEYLAESGYDSKMGARPLARKIDELVRVPLSKKILFEQVKNATVAVTVDSDKKIVFNTVTKMSAKVNNNGIIEVS